MHVKVLGPPSEQKGSQDLWTPDYISPTQSLTISANVILALFSFYWVIPGEAHSSQWASGNSCQGQQAFDALHNPLLAVLLAPFSRKLNCFSSPQGWTLHTVPLLEQPLKDTGWALNYGAVCELPLPFPRSQLLNYLSILILQGQSSPPFSFKAHS